MIHFVGAGPGAADLLTVRAVRLLRGADVCVYAGSYVDAVLSHCRDGVELVDTQALDLEQITEAQWEAIRADKRTDQVVQTFVNWLEEQQRREAAGEEATDHHGGPVQRRLHLHFWHRPVEVLGEDGRVTGMRFERVRAEYDARGRRRLVPTGEPDEVIPCDEVLIAVGQENAFPWIERDLGIAFDEWGMPVVDEVTHQSSLPKVLFGGDAAFGPKNIIWAVAHGHAAAISIDRLISFCFGPCFAYLITPSSSLMNTTKPMRNQEENRLFFAIPPIPIRGLERVFRDF